MPRSHTTQTSTESVPSASTDGYDCRNYDWVSYTLQESTGGAGDTVDVDLYTYNALADVWSPRLDFGVNGTLQLTAAQEHADSYYVGKASRFAFVVSAVNSGGGLNGWVEAHNDRAGC